ncbi:MAG: N-acetylmuramoyl-L-alanine amidase CwlD [Clostridia bacterium]
MVVINRKKIIFWAGIIATFIFMYSITAYNVNNTKNKTVATVALPVNNKVIVIDAGHGVPDEGAQSNNGTTEAESNLKIALKVQNLLEQSGATVILTRSDENAIYDLDSNTLKQKKISDIHNRVKIGNESSADIFVSIHLNKIPQQQYWGWQTFYKQESPEGQKLATCIQNSLNQTIQKQNDRVPLKIDNVYIIKHVEIPISIVECGFLSNPEEEQLLLTDDYQTKLAWGIYTGIMDYFYNM